MSAPVWSALVRAVPAPAAVLHQLWADRATLTANGAVTLREAAVGYLWGNGAALVMGGAFVRVPWIERSLLRIAVAGYCLPLVVVGPILVVLFSGDGAKVALAALSVFFTTLLCALQGLKAAPPASVDVVRSLGGGSQTIFWRVRVPGALPAVCAGLRIGAPTALLGAVIGEYFGANDGLGAALVQAQSAYEVARTWAIALALAVLAGVLYGALALATAPAARWSMDDAVAVGLPADPAAGERGPILRSSGFLLWSAAWGIGLWYLAIFAFHLDHYFVKTPLDVARYFFGPGGGANRTELAGALGTTLVDTGVGLAAGMGLAIAAAALLALRPGVEAVVMPAVVFLRSIPIVAMTPLIALVFGRGLLAVTVVVSLVVFFPTLVIVRSGLQAAPRAAGDLVLAMGGNASLVMRKVRAGYALPWLFTAARNAVPAALGGAILAEWLATGAGAGNLLVVAASESRFDTLWAGSVVLVLLSGGVYAGLGMVERAAQGGGRPSYRRAALLSAPGRSG